MSDTAQGPGWWQASDGKWYPPDQTAGAGARPPDPPKPVRPAPDWVRPVYLYFLSFIVVLIAALGAMTFVLALVHVAAPDLDQGDPISRLTDTVIVVTQAVIDAEQSGSEEDDFSSSAVPPELEQGIEDVESGIDDQTRKAALNDLVKGIILMGIGAGIYLFHWRKAEAAGA
jgi:hypothetical protein